jgi:hypothetical protein
MLDHVGLMGQDKLMKYYMRLDCQQPCNVKWGYHVCWPGAAAEYIEIIIEIQAGNGHV